MSSTTTLPALLNDAGQALCRAHDGLRYEDWKLIRRDSPPSEEPRLNLEVRFACGARLRFTRTTQQLCEMPFNEFYQLHRLLASPFAQLVAYIVFQWETARLGEAHDR